MLERLSALWIAAYGSLVELVRREGTVVKAWVRGDGIYLAANDPRVHFGLGQDTEVNRIQVRWLGGNARLGSRLRWIRS